MRNRQIVVVAAGGMSLALLTACGFGGADGDPTVGATTSGDDGVGGGSITYLETFTPAAGFALESDDAFILTRIGCAEPLVRFDNGEMVPSLASSWEQVEPTAWEFTLESVSFQDGTPMTAEAVVGSLEYLLGVEAPPRSFNPSTVAGVSAVDDGTVRIETPAEDPLLPLRVTAPNTSILAPDAYTESGAIDPIGNCTGPFEITSISGIESLSMVANDEYWAGEVGLDAVEVRFVVDGQSRVTQLQTGEATLASNLPATSLALIEGDGAIVAEPFDLPRTTALYFNVTQAPFDDPTVRQAIRLAIDTQAIVDAVYEGYGSPAVGPFTPTAAWAPAGAAPVALDPDAASALLDEAGIDPASLDFELIAYTDRPEFADLAQVIQSQLDAIGITVTITGGEWAAVEGDVMAGNYEGLLLSRNALTDIPDPGGFLTSDYTCGGGFNIARFCDEAVDAQLAEAVANADPQARYAIYQDVATQLQDDAVTIFLVHEVATYGHLTTLQGFEPNPLGQYAVTADLTLAAE